MRIAILATPMERGHQIAEALGLVDAIVLSSRNPSPGRGLVLDCLLIDESALPLADHKLHNLAATLNCSTAPAVFEIREFVL